MRIVAKANTTALQEHFEKIREYQRTQMLKTAGKEIVLQILMDTAGSKDAYGRPFSAYSASQKKKRLKHGLSVDAKTLWFFGDMLKSLQFWDGRNEVNVGAAFDKIAEGQMYHPKWKDESHSRFLLASEQAQTNLEIAIKADLDKINRQA